MVRRTRTAKRLGTRHDLNYFKRWSASRKWRLWLSVGLPLLLVVWLLAGIPGGDASSLSPGPMSHQHAFIGTSGISLTHGYSTPNALDAQVKEAMIASAEEAYIVADSSKFGHDCLVSFADLGSMCFLITDSGIPAEYVKEFRKRGVRFRIATSPGSGEG